MLLDFDRGTILIECPTPGLDVRALPGVLWDPRVRRFRAPGWRYRDLLADLRGRGIQPEDRAGAKLHRPAVAPFAPVDLRPYQQAALTAWEVAGRRGVVGLPTGSGKTRVGVAAMASVGGSALCLVPTRVLMHQWRDELERLYQGPVGCWGDGERRPAAIAVATFESACRQMPRIGSDFELLLVDEVHHFGCAMRDEALEMAIAPARLGLSATPPENGAAAERIAALVGPTVYELSMGDLAGSYLAEFDVIVLHLELDPDERQSYERELGAFRSVHRAFARVAPGASWQDFVAAAGRTADGRRALAAWRQSRRMLGFTRAKAAAVAALLERHWDSRVLVFTADNETAYAIAREHLIMPLTCDIRRKERDDVLARFRTGDLRALVSARVLNEGLDVPEAEVAIVVGGSAGAREHVQRVGRLLRPRPGKRALVYELVTRATAEARQAMRRRRALAAGGRSARGNAWPSAITGAAS